MYRSERSDILHYCQRFSRFVYLGLDFLIFDGRTEVPYVVRHGCDFEADTFLAGLRLLPFRCTFGNLGFEVDAFWWAAFDLDERY